ncbi:MAG: glycosyltransferase family 4 protein [Anaerolineales bacterium]
MPEDRPYRVLMLAPTSFFGDYGCHVRILEEVRFLQGCGHRVTICTYPIGRDLPGLDLRRTMRLPWRGHYEVGSSRHKIALDALLAVRALGLRRSVRPDVIHSHLHEGALIGSVLSRLWGVPQLFDFQGSMTAEMVDHHFLQADTGSYRAVRRLERWIDQRAPRILTSTTQATRLLTETFGCAPERVIFAPDCVNTEVFCPPVRDEAWQALRRSWGVPDGRPALVYLGLLADYQGTDHLLQALAMLTRQGLDVHLLLGGYPNVERYRQMAASLGLADRVTLAGRVPYDEAPAFLGLGDIAVAPKLSKTEGAGKILNYMAMGLPVVAYDTSASREYLGEMGVYAERGNPEALAARLGELARQPDLGRARGAALRKRAEEQFHWGRTGQIILDAYAALLGKPGESKASA